MAIDLLAVFQSTFDALPKQAAWTANFAGWVDDRVTLKMALPGLSPPTALTFTFNKPTFKAALDLLTNVPDKTIGIANFANAWGDAVTASTAIVPAGSSVGVPSNPTTWSVVTTSLIDPPSVLAGKAMINTLALEPNSSMSKFPEIFRNAFLLLTVTTTGLDSTPTPTGPLPLVDLARAVA